MPTVLLLLRHIGFSVANRSRHASKIPTYDGRYRSVFHHINRKIPTAQVPLVAIDPQLIFGANMCA